MGLSQALSELTLVLEELDYDFALIGGLAASVLGEPRFTSDVDLAIRVADDSEAEALLFALNQRGYPAVATIEQEQTSRLATARIQSPNGTICDLVFATSGIEPELVASATPLEALGMQLPVVSAEGILAMKTLSASDDRPQDLGDIRAILINTLDLEEAQLLRFLSLITERNCNRGQDLLKKWSSLKVRFSPK